MVSLPIAKATPRGEANPPSPSGCGGRPPSPASLLLGVSLWIRRRRRSWDSAAWHSQRGSREVVKGALSFREFLAERLSRWIALSYPESVLVSRLWWRLALKRMFDLASSLLLTVAVAPLMLLIALLVKCDSPGPVLFVQERAGRSGRSFRMLKFRTMVKDAEAQTGPIWACGEKDPRITRVGRFLRRTHMDELPQLINVLRGEMSLVGPRPERPCFIGDLSRQVPSYADRLFVKPGLTGLAQIHYRYDQTVSDVKKKLRFDLLYIRRMCLTFDLRILFSTMRVVATGRGVR